MSVFAGLILVFSMVPPPQNFPDGVFGTFDYDASIPRLKSVVAFDFGEKMTMHHEACAYVKALAEASPRVSFQVHGSSWEGRDMILVFVTSEANQGKLDQLRKGYQVLADSRQASEEARQQLIDELPVSMMLWNSVHGDETSGTDAGLLLAWHLAAAKDPKVQQLLDRVVVILELMQNPDGRDRFITLARFNRGFPADPDPQAAEHHQDWASGRYNHYLFDLNRDWFAMTQPETKAKVSAYLSWFPQVSIDLHEMGADRTFFAVEPAAPIIEILPERLRHAYSQVGMAIGKAFDRRHWDYFHGEVFDLFYPGYGDSWPAIQGSVGMLFEQGYTRGLQIQPKGRPIRAYRDAVAQQAVAAYAVMDHAQSQRKQILADFFENRRECVQGLAGLEYSDICLLPGDDPGQAVDLGKLLLAQGIEVGQLRELQRGIQSRFAGEKSLRKRELPVGTLVVNLRQPNARLAWVLLADQINMDPSFVEEQERLYARRSGNQIYDITAWSLPMTYGVQALYSLEKVRDPGRTEIKIPFSVEFSPESLAVLVPYRSRTISFLAQLLRQGFRVSFSTRPIKHQGREFPRGTLILRAHENEGRFDALAEMCRTFQVTAFGTDTSWFEEGPSLGSSQVRYLDAPRLAMFWGAPFDPSSSGWARYAIEQSLGYPVTVLRPDRWAVLDLDRYDVLVLPNLRRAGMDQELSKGLEGKLARFVTDGGLLVTVGDSSKWLTELEKPLLASALEAKDGLLPGDGPVKEHPRKPEADFEAMIQPVQEEPRLIPGALSWVLIDQSHWMGFGMDLEQAVMVHSNRVFRPLRLDRGDNVARYADPDRVLASGFMPEASREQLGGKAYLMVQPHGKGLVVAFAEDPNFRGFMHGLLPFFSNACLFGPAFTR